jgi:signal peptidase
MIDDRIRDRGRKLLSVGIVVALAVGLAITVVVAFPQLVGAEHSYVVISDSMSPTIDTGDVVIVRETATESIDRGDVITFRRSERRITHRVVEVVENDGSRAFRTKGDANEVADRSLVSAEHVVGRVWFHLPYVGYAMVFASSKEGLLALVIVPATLLVVSESYVLARTVHTGPPGDRPPGVENGELPVEEVEAAGSDGTDSGSD